MKKCLMAHEAITQAQNIKLSFYLEGAKPYHAKPFPIPKIHEKTLKPIDNRLIKIDVLKRKNNSKWADPIFIIPKINGIVRFISNLRELNQRIKRKSFPFPKTQDFLFNLEGFKYATSLDLNMGYYHIKLCPFPRKLCTMVLPWGKYEYQELPMGLCNSPDIFQEKEKISCDEMLLDNFSILLVVVIIIL